MRNDRTRIEKLIDHAPFKPTHFKIWILSAFGVFMDGLDLFIIAVALPLIDYQFHPSKWELGLIGAASPVGAIFGAMFLGYITDRFGRKKLYVSSMAFFVIFSFLCAIAWSAASLIFFRFLLGIAIGSDYPISSTYLSEFMPKRIRERAIISAFSFQALGAMGGAGIGLMTLIFYPSADAWRVMLGLTILPAIVTCILRMGLPESALWLQSRKELGQAAIVVASVLEKPTQKILSVLKSEKWVRQTAVVKPKKSSYRELFHRRHLRQTLLTSVPWFIMDICLYGVGMFTTVILALVFSHFAKPNDTMAQSFILTSIRAVSGSLFLDIFLVVGFIFSILAVKKMGAIRLQNMGFIGMTIGLIVLGIATHVQHSEVYVFIGFAIFNLMVNFGPNPTTYMLPTERFPPHIRASGHGFAASAGKVGAAIGIFFLPVCIKTIGTSPSMFILAAFAFSGFLCTAILARRPLRAGRSHASHSSI